MPLTDHRQVRKDYWYTSAQIMEVGRHWAQQSPDRLFLHSQREIPNRTALELDNIPIRANLPKKLLLPLNKGRSHWTSVPILLSEGDDGRINVQIFFTDSLNKNQVLSKHSSSIRLEIARIENLFRDFYGARNVHISSQVYPHTWTQPDGSSCGPYCLANGARCLDGAGAEPNPGRQVIREQQLNMMTTWAAIHGCSSDNTLDEILLDWMIDQAQSGQSLHVSTSEDVQTICLHYASKYNREPHEIAALFLNEYAPAAVHPTFRPVPVNMRVHELIGELGLTTAAQTRPLRKQQANVKPSSAPTPTVTPPVTAPENPKPPAKHPKFREDYSDLKTEELITQFRANEGIKKAIASMGKVNICRKIDTMRDVLSRAIGDDIYALDVMEQITMHMHKANLQEVEQLIRIVLPKEEQSAHREKCLDLASEIIGLRQFSKDNDEKFIYLASAYSSLCEAMKNIKTPRLANLKAPKEILNAHAQLLQGAIDRNSAPLLRQVSFAIRDFCSYLLDEMSSGLWQSSIKRIETIQNQFKDKQGSVNVEHMRSEQMAIQTLLNARSSLEKEITKEDRRLRSQRSFGG